MTALFSIDVSDEGSMGNLPLCITNDKKNPASIGTQLNVFQIVRIQSNHFPLIN